MYPPLSAVETQVAHEHKAGQEKTHHLKGLALRPSITAKPNDLENTQVQAYQKTWARRDASGTIVNVDNRRKFKFYQIFCRKFGLGRGGVFGASCAGRRRGLYRGLRKEEAGVVLRKPCGSCSFLWRAGEKQPAGPRLW